MEFLGKHSRHKRDLEVLTKLASELRERPIPERHRPTRQYQHRVTDEELAGLIADYEAGALQRELAGKYNVNRETVGLVLSRAGVIKRRKGLDACQVEEAARLYEEGWSTLRLGRRFGVDAQTVATTLRKAGVAIRSRRGR